MPGDAFQRGADRLADCEQRLWINAAIRWSRQMTGFFNPSAKGLAMSLVMGVTK